MWKTNDGADYGTTFLQYFTGRDHICRPHAYGSHFELICQFTSLHDLFIGKKRFKKGVVNHFCDVSITVFHCFIVFDWSSEMQDTKKEFQKTDLSVKRAFFLPET
jgi:hypothetical protein